MKRNLSLKTLVVLTTLFNLAYGVITDELIKQLADTSTVLSNAIEAYYNPGDEDILRTRIETTLDTFQSAEAALKASAQAISNAQTAIKNDKSLKSDLELPIKNAQNDLKKFVWYGTPLKDEDQPLLAALVPKIKETAGISNWRLPSEELKKELGLIDEEFKNLTRAIPLSEDTQEDKQNTILYTLNDPFIERLILRTARVIRNVNFIINQDLTLKKPDSALINSRDTTLSHLINFIQNHLDQNNKEIALRGVKALLPDFSLPEPSSTTSSRKSWEQYGEWFGFGS